MSDDPNKLAQRKPYVLQSMANMSMEPNKLIAIAFQDISTSRIPS
ncbi:hypothetical protein [Paenibacillus sp. LHD-38]|nr:hypothetical protein [Paenibacillus sp. LHD-38]MDQ8737731.1 hypothetical protein [Paenibacillus sp. LHD-38]